MENQEGYENQEEYQQNLEKYRAMDTDSQGRKQYEMLIDSWNQDGAYSARFDEFGPVADMDEPPTLNGKQI